MLESANKQIFYMDSAGTFYYAACLQVVQSTSDPFIYLLPTIHLLTFHFLLAAEQWVAWNELDGSHVCRLETL